MNSLEALNQFDEYRKVACFKVYESISENDRKDSERLVKWLERKQRQ